MDYSIEKADTAVTLILRGNLSIADAAALRTVMSQLMVEGKTSQLELNLVTSIDLACLQVLYSAWISAKNKHIVMTISGEIPLEVTQTVEQAGFQNLDWPFAAHSNEG